MDFPGLLAAQGETDAQFSNWQNAFMTIVSQIHDSAQNGCAKDALEALDKMLEGRKDKFEILSKMLEHITCFKREIQNKAFMGESAASGVPVSSYFLGLHPKTADASLAVQVNGNMVQVFVESLAGKTIIVHAGSTGNVIDLKDAIFRKEEIPPDQQRLLTEGRLLDDTTKISTLVGATVQLGARLLGGSEPVEDDDLPELTPEQAIQMSLQVSEPNTVDDSEELHEPESDVEDASAETDEVTIPLTVARKQLHDMLTLCGESQATEKSLESVKQFYIMHYGWKAEENKGKINDFQNEISSCGRKMHSVKTLMDLYSTKLAILDADQDLLQDKMDSYHQRKANLQDRLEKAHKDADSIETQRKACEEGYDAKIAAACEQTEKLRQMIEERESLLSPDVSDAEDET